MSALDKNREIVNREPASILFSPRFYGFLKHIISVTEIEPIINNAIDYAIELSNAERGMIILFDSQGEIYFQAARHLTKEDILHPSFEISQTIIKKVKHEAKPICLRNALEDKSIISESIGRLKLLSVICMPLINEEKVFGVVYLDNRAVTGIFEQGICEFLIEFTDFISLAAFRAYQHHRLQLKINDLEEQLRAKYRLDAIVGHHPKMIELLKLLSQIADTEATVLIQGESGTGKELVARALHFNNNKRKGNMFIPVNCGAIPEALLESELFGHVKGAYTGAVSNKIGLFEKADGGTVLLDEVSEMSPALQVKLLRILQTGEYVRVGSPDIRYCDVRVIAATNTDLQQTVQNGKFREDVYYRLNIIELLLPPLRERRSDVPILANHFLNIYSNKYGKTISGFSHEVEHVFSNYDFPGNIRELENIVQRAVVLAEGPKIEKRLLPAYLLGNDRLTSRSKKTSFKVAKKKILADFEKAFVTECIKNSKGNIRRAAENAGMDYKNFYDKLKKYSIRASQYH